MSLPDRDSVGSTGLAGIVSFGADLDVSRARVYLRQAVGADVEEAVIDHQIAVAHSGGRVHRAGDLSCAFEGRLANRESLATRLGAHAGAPPAEVAAAAYTAWGAEAIAELRGEYVVVLWNSADGSGLLAHDHLGGRSLFIRTDGSRLVFASDVRLVLRLLPSRPDVDPLGVVQWLLLGGAVAGRTLHAGIRRLEPASLLKFDRRSWSERRYWRPRYAAPLEISREEAADELRAVLKTTVLSQIGEADAGVMLSGGLDSGTVAAVAAEALRESDRSLVGYSMTFPHHPAIDESQLVRAVSDRLALPSVQMRVLGGSMLRGGLEFLRYWELPTPAPNAVFITALQRYAAAEGIGVLLDGEGGDELFAADPFLAAAHVRRGELLAAWRTCQQIPGFASLPTARDIMRAFSALAVRGAAPYWMAHMRRSLRHPEELVPEWLSSSSACAFAKSHDPWAWKRSSAPLWWAHLSHTLSVNREEMWAFDCLRQLGTISGVERRHPLLDLDAVELVLQLPPRYAYDSHLDRALARRAMKSRLPDSVTARAEKSFFTSLLRESLLGSDLPVARRLLESPEAEIRRFVEPRALSTFLDAASSGHEPPEFATQAWRLVMAECWLRSQVDADFADNLITSTQLAEPTIEFARHLPGPGGRRLKAWTG